LYRCVFALLPHFALLFLLVRYTQRHWEGARQTRDRVEKVSKSTGDRVPQWAGGMRREPRFCWLWATMGSNGHTLKRVQISIFPFISKPKPRTAIRFEALSFPGVRLCQPVNDWMPPKQRSPRYEARAGAHFCKAFMGANSANSDALLGVSMGKFLGDERVDRRSCWRLFRWSKK